MIYQFLDWNRLLLADYYSAGQWQDMNSKGAAFLSKRALHKEPTMANAKKSGRI